MAMAFSSLLQSLYFSDDEKTYFKSRIVKLRTTWASERENEIKNTTLRLDQTKDRLNRLTDAYLDQALDKTMFEQRKKGLLLEQKAFEETLANLSRDNAHGPDRLEKFLELASNASLSHQMASPEEKREMVKILTSNRQVNGKNIELKPSIPFEAIEKRFETTTSPPERDIPRIWDRLLDILSKLNAADQLPDLSVIFRSGGSTTN
jgi:uncharacterized protein YueI